MLSEYLAYRYGRSRQRKMDEPPTPRGPIDDLVEAIALVVVVIMVAVAYGLGN